MKDYLQNKYYYDVCKLNKIEYFKICFKGFKKLMPTDAPI